jgi:hypothetical protein
MPTFLDLFQRRKEQVPFFAKVLAAGAQRQRLAR